MIILNGKKFAKNDREFTDSLFDIDGTCVGYYKRYKRSIKLFDHQHNLVGGINKHGVLHSSTELDTITKNPDDTGKYWHTYGNPDIIGDYDLIQQIDDIHKIATKTINTEMYYK